MSCSTLPRAQLLRRDTSSKISFRRSLAASPAAQRRLQRVMEAGMGLAARQAPLAYWKKSAQGSALRSTSATCTPTCCWASVESEQNVIKRSFRRRIVVLERIEILLSAMLRNQSVSDFSFLVAQAEIPEKRG